MGPATLRGSVSLGVGERKPDGSPPVLVNFQMHGEGVRLFWFSCAGFECHVQLAPLCPPVCLPATAPWYGHSCVSLVSQVPPPRASRCSVWTSTMWCVGALATLTPASRAPPSPCSPHPFLVGPQTPPRRTSPSRASNTSWKAVTTRCVAAQRGGMARWRCLGARCTLAVNPPPLFRHHAGPLVDGVRGATQPRRKQADVAQGAGPSFSGARPFFFPSPVQCLQLQRFCAEWCCAACPNRRIGVSFRERVDKGPGDEMVV